MAVDRIQSLINLAIINFDFSDPRKSINILQQIEREIESGENFLEQGDKLIAPGQQISPLEIEKIKAYELAEDTLKGDSLFLNEYIE